MKKVLAMALLWGMTMQTSLRAEDPLPLSVIVGNDLVIVTYTNGSNMQATQKIQGGQGITTWKLTPPLEGVRPDTKVTVQWVMKSDGGPPFTVASEMIGKRLDIDCTGLTQESSVCKCNGHPCAVSKSRSK